MESLYRFVNTPTIEPSKAEVKDRPQRRSKDLIWVWLCWLPVIVALYLLSLGPVMMMLQNRVISPSMPTITFIMTFYYPIDWAGNKIPMLKRPIGMYLHLWAPKLIDSKGNATGA